MMMHPLRAIVVLFAGAAATLLAYLVVFCIVLMFAFAGMYRDRFIVKHPNCFHGSNAQGVFVRCGE